MQYRLSSAAARDEDRQKNRRNRKNDRCPRRNFRENIDGSARTKGSLRTLPAKRARQICTFAWLQQNNPDQYETYDDMNDSKEINHWVTFEERTECATETKSGVPGAEGGT